MENINAIIEAEATKAQRQGKRKAVEISQCDDEIKVLREQLTTSGEKRRRLQAEKQQYTLVETLKANGARAWNALGNERKWKKANVLAVLCSDKDEKLPYQLAEGPRQWRTDAAPTGNAVPEALRQDRDVLLARLARKDFSLPYRWEVTFRLPPEFHDDKTVVLATMKQYPKILEQDVLTEALLGDRDVFLAFLHSATLTEREAGLLSKFSEGIRGNASLMLEAAKQLNAIVVLDSFTERLAGNYSFAQKLVKTLDEQSHSTIANDRALGRFSKSVRSRKDIVLGLVQKNGRCLQDADPSLRRDSEVVRTACTNNASALAFADGSTQRQLGRSYEFLMEIFSRWPEGASGDPKLYGRLPKALKLDRNIAIAANKDGNLSFTDLPAELKRDAEFWLDVIKRDASFWRGLPEEYENDPSFVQAVECFGDKELVASVFERFPSLTNERDVWLAIISSHDYMDIRQVIGQHAPEHIRHDKELMAIASENNLEVMGMLSEELQTDRAIVEAVVRGSGYFALRSIPHSTQCLYPDLVIQALDSDNDDEDAAMDDLADNDGTVLADSLWSNIGVIRAWFNNGGHVHSRFPDSLKNDADFGLALASGLIKSWHDFADFEWWIAQFRDNTSVELRKNKEFMMQAVALDGWFLLEAAGDLRRDVDLAIAAYSTSNGLMEYQLDRDNYHTNTDSDIEFVKRVRNTARSRANDHKGFLEGFLPGMSQYAGTDCHLLMLVKGPETTLAFKKLIAEFVGVPTAGGRQSLKQLLKCVSNLSNIPEPSPDDCSCDNCRMRWW